MTELLTTAEAARLAGVKLTTVHQACISGALRSTQEAGGRRRRIIRRRDFVRWRAEAATRGPRTRTGWTEADIAAMLELSSTCSATQLARYLGKTEKAIHNARRKYQDQLPVPAERNRLPWRIPSTGVLIAKTCTKCGEVRDAHYFAKKRKRQWSYHDSHCARCRNQYRRDKGYRYPECPSVINHELLQDATRPQASNERKRYTSDERALLADMTLGELEIAYKLNRTYGAIVHQRREMGLYPQRQRLTESQWLLKLAAANLSDLERFRNLADVTAPEALYGEWPDWPAAAAS